ncbi:MAG: hypothetical protein H6833_07805, partial [Planctomycetes bacterium]|nr:hypothetical protein [Planctomycetota bacterium]
YTVAIVHGDDLYEVEVDAISGKVLEIEEDDDEDEVAAYRNVLRHAELSLTQLVQHAQGVVKGHPVHAELEMEGKHPICDVAIANGRYLIDVELEARAGHVLELELASLDEDEDEGHHHGKGGHGNEEDDDEDEGEGDEDGI